MSGTKAEVELKKIRARGIPIEYKSDHHYRIAGNIDFWPSTQKYRQMNGKASGKGTDGLLKLLEGRARSTW